MKSKDAKKNLDELESYRKIIRNLDKEKLDLKKKNDEFQGQLVDYKEKVRGESQKRHKEVQKRVDDMKNKKELEKVDLVEKISRLDKEKKFLEKE